MKSSFKAWLGRWARFTVCLLLLVWIFHAIFCNEAQLHLTATGENWDSLTKWDQRHLAWTLGPEELWQKSRRIHLGWALLALGQCGLLVFVGALRWRYVMSVQGLKLSVREATQVSYVAHFFNAFLLGSTGGDVWKAWYVARATHHKKAEAALSVFVDRLLGIVALLFFAVVMMPFNGELLIRYKRYAGFSIVIVGMLAASLLLVVLALFTDTLSEGSRYSMWLRRLPQGASISRALAACRMFGRCRGFTAKVAGWSILINLLIVGTFVALSLGMNLQIPIHTLLLVVPMVVCLAAIPITPSGLGVRENLFVFLLAIPAFAVKHSDMLSLSLLGYTATLVWSVVGGVLYLWMPNRAAITTLAASDVEI